MATVPIVTEVAKAQLDALVAANGLNEGLQYKVTDKNWLLIATSDNTLKPLNNDLFLLNGDTLPIYIDCRKIIIDTGLLPQSSYDPYLAISLPDGFYVASLYLPPIEPDGTYITMVMLMDSDENVILGPVGGQPTISFPNKSDFYYINPSLRISATVYGTNARIYLMCEKVI